MSASARVIRGWGKWSRIRPCSPSARSNRSPRPDRLDSWKEIAAYLNRSERTVRRWEDNEELPVHRLQHDKRGSVYAYTRELDAWRVSRRVVVEATADEPPSRRIRPVWWVAGVLAIVIAAIVVGMRVRAANADARTNAGYSRTTRRGRRFSGRASAPTPGVSRSRPAFAITVKPPSSIRSLRAPGEDWRRGTWR